MTKSAPAHAFLRTESLRGRASARKVVAIESSLRKEGWIGAPISALEFKGELYILDGHHRVLAARHAGLEVQYRVVPPESLIDFGYHSVEEVLVAHAEVAPNKLPPIAE